MLIKCVRQHWKAWNVVCYIWPTLFFTSISIQILNVLVHYITFIWLMLLSKATYKKCIQTCEYNPKNHTSHACNLHQTCWTKSGTRFRDIKVQSELGLNNVPILYRCIVSIGRLKDWLFNPQLLQSACRSVLSKIFNPELLARAFPSVCECVWMSN